MTIALRFSTSLVSALLVTSMALHASAADPPAPAPDAGPRKHVISASAGPTPFYIGAVAGSSERYDYDDAVHEPLLIGLSGDYMRSFGLFRAGVGLRYTNTQEGMSRGGSSIAHTLGIYGLLGLGITTRSGVDIAATLGLGLGHCWMPQFDLYAPRWGGGAELLISVAIPVDRDTDFLVRSGAGIAYYTGDVPPAPEGVWQTPDPYLLHIHAPIELGFRKRF